MLPPGTKVTKTLIHLGGRNGMTGIFSNDIAYKANYFTAGNFAIPLLSSS
jgi:hypothetical protein